MNEKIEQLISNIYETPYNKEAFRIIEDAIKLIDDFIDK